MATVNHHTKAKAATHCFLRISVAGSEPENVVIALNNESCPQTCRNFVSLCSSSAVASKPSRSAARESSSSDPIRTYRRTEFHRVVPGFMVQGGDYENFDGTGGQSYRGGTFPDESFEMKHDAEGIVSMANKGKNTNGSQFFITLASVPHLDGKHVAFGRVESGMDVVRAMAQVECEGDRPVPMQRIVVVGCGEGTGAVEEDVESSSSSENTSSSNEGRRRSHKKKRRRTEEWNGRRKGRSRSRRRDGSRSGDERTHRKRSREKGDSDDRRRRRHRKGKRKDWERKDSPSSHLREHDARDDSRKKRHGGSSKSGRRRRDRSRSR